jgi:hypothetical protein
MVPLVVLVYMLCKMFLAAYIACRALYLAARKQSVSGEDSGKECRLLLAKGIDREEYPKDGHPGGGGGGGA